MSTMNEGIQSTLERNDVLAAIGVVERRYSASEAPPETVEQRILRLEQLENEDSAGNAVALASTLTENICTWWIGSLRDRILTFHPQATIPFSQMVAYEYRASGTGIVYAGFLARLLSTVSVQASVYAALVFRPLDRLLFGMRASRKTRVSLQRWKSVMNHCFRLFVEIIFYPFAYHANLQRLGLVPARPFFPPWRAFMPFSALSPIRTIALPVTLTAPSIIDFVKSSLSSPLVFVCLEHFLERWVYAVVYEAIESTTTQPDHPDLTSPDDGVKNRATAILGLRRKSPAMIRNAINRLLVTLGWGKPFPSLEPGEHRNRAERRLEIDQNRPVQVGGTQVTGLNRLRIPAVHLEVQPVSGLLNVSNTTLAPDQPLQPVSPASPTASEASQDGNDPRIRITSREGIVEMEVRLPPQIISTRTEVSGTNPPTPNQPDVAAPTPVPEPETPTYHRVTQLSTEPAQMIGAVLKAQIVTWVTLPLKIITLRLIASHYHRSHQQYAGLLPRVPLYPGIFGAMGSPSQLAMRSTGLFLSRVALCGAMEVAIDLGLWGCQWAAVTWIGKKYFGWGTL
ncbi:hypothetical protein K469DRAFT_695338 [Zopfia rhizophila CBS 207.26]|uniref:Uncharacterized protein n=1 Tax=Zopfia rhizophila CBS 207.26 TaxID=1314779 RepID=A0A6A6DGE0_9PEZI|nr:hypothetical protein K469DRAFT_695338 [Zopfia rhizophila CBS 207.26]